MKIIESDFEYKEYRCVIIFHDGGFRCGYVGLPKGHPLYGKDYNDKLKATFEEILDQPFGKRNPFQMLLFTFNNNQPEDEVQLGLYFDVHGGITYSDGGDNSTHPIESSLWWLGFDCGHAGDDKDWELVEKLWGDEPVVQRRLEYEKEIHFEGDVLRTLEYVQQECKNLVDQIIDYCERYEG